MDWKKFEPYFEGEWGKRIKPFIESESADKMYNYLKTRKKDGHKIVPHYDQIYRCFKETPYNQLKCVMIGMAPYHSTKRVGDEDIVVADGLLMGCSNTETLQPSLEKFYEGVEVDCYKGLKLDYIKVPDVYYLASQGVLMWNISLTTEIDRPMKHLEAWKPFTIYVLEEIIAQTGVPVIFLGKEAAQFRKYLAPMQWNFVIEHPAFAARKETIWDTKGAFTSVNKILKDQNNEEIEWLFTLPF